MYVQMSVSFSARVRPHGRQRSAVKSFTDFIESEIPEVGIIDAPVAVSWVTRNGGAANNGLTNNEVHSHDGRTFAFAHGAKAARTKPLKEQIRLLFEKRFGEFSADGAVALRSKSRSLDFVDSREMDRTLYDANRILSDLLIIDGQLYSRVATPVYAFNWNDNFNGSFNYTFRTFPGLSSSLTHRYYSADQYDQFMRENGPLRRGVVPRDKMQVEVFIPEALQFDGPGCELLNAAAYSIQAGFRKWEEGVPLESNHPDREHWDLWSDLLHSFRQARDTWGEDDLSNLYDAFRSFVEYVGPEFYDIRRWGQRAVRDVLQRWEERPLDLAPAALVGPGAG